MTISKSPRSPFAKLSVSHMSGAGHKEDNVL